MSVTVNGRPTDISAGTTVSDIVAQLGVRPTGTAVAVNGAVVPRSAWPSAAIEDGDSVEVLAAVQGG